MDGCHQQCRRDSLATDVANSQNQSVRIHGEEIVIIATDRARGAAKPMHFERRQLRNVLREKHRLHFLGDGQLILQSLLRFLLLDQVLDRSSHRIERVGKRGELITRLDRNAMAEISAIYMLGRQIKLRDGPRHRAGKARADKERQQLDDGETDGQDRKSTRLNSSHPSISYAVFCLKKKKTK